MSEYPCQYKTSAPKLGEHDNEIFEQLGYSREKLDEYRSKGALI
jgi:formyl-CoA transferase